MMFNEKYTLMSRYVNIPIYYTFWQYHQLPDRPDKIIHKGFYFGC